MTSGSRIGIAMAIAGWALVTDLAWAGPVQINPPPMGSGTGFTGIAVQHPMGQSFIANGDTVHTVELQLMNLNMSFELSQDRMVTLDLFEGVGFGGTHLASKAVDVDEILGRLVGTQGKVDFALGGVAVKPGDTYSFQLRAVTVRFGSVWFAGNPYADGTAILQGQAFDDPDLYFGISAVPAPHGTLLMLAGLALVWSMRSRRQFCNTGPQASPTFTASGDFDEEHRPCHGPTGCRRMHLHGRRVHGASRNTVVRIQL